MTATCDVDCGSYYGNHLKHGVEHGFLKEEDLDEGRNRNRTRNHAMFIHYS